MKEVIDMTNLLMIILFFTEMSFDLTCPSIVLDQTSDYESDSVNSSFDNRKFVGSYNGIFLGHHDEGRL